MKLANAVHVQEQCNSFQCSMNYIRTQHWFRLTSVSIFALYCSQLPHAYHTTHWPQICCIPQAVCRCRGTQVNAFHSAKGNPSSWNACHQAANVKCITCKTLLLSKCSFLSPSRTQLPLLDGSCTTT